MKKFKKIYIEITNICNKNCSFCLGSKKKKQEMSIEQFEHILNEIQPYTNYVYLHIKGEPLLHSKFKEIIELCKKYNIIVNITTNGTLIHKQMEVISTANNIRQINISLQSIEKEKDIFEFDSILNNVETLLSNNNIIFVYRLWALKNNELTDINIKLVNQLVDYYKLDHLKEEIYNKQNIELKNNLYLNKAEIFEWPNLNNEFVSDKGFCYGLKSHVGILSDGTVVPCCLDDQGVINLGNIFNEKFDFIIEKEKTKKIIKGFKNNCVEEELCKHCSYKNRFKKNKNENML